MFTLFDPSSKEKDGWLEVCLKARAPPGTRVTSAAAFQMHNLSHSVFLLYFNNLQLHLLHLLAPVEGELGHPCRQNPLRPNAQCAVCKVRCHCIFYGPGIRYSDIFGAPGIRYSVIIKLPCALLQTGHLETVHAPVADTVAYFADLDAPVVDTVTYFGGNHRSRV